MTIKASIEQKIPQIEINLDGPEGNIFTLFNLVKQLSGKLGLDGDLIIRRMQHRSGGYEHAVKVFDAYFGNYVTLRTNEPERFA